MDTIPFLLGGVVLGLISVPFLVWLRARLAADTTAAPLDPLTEAIQAIDDRVETLERAEATREAFAAESLDKFTRLYKRMAELQSRQDRSGSTIDAEEGSESPLEMRRRLRGQ